MLVADSLSFSSFPVVFGLREMVINNWEGGFNLRQSFFVFLFFFNMFFIVYLQIALIFQI